MLQQSLDRLVDTAAWWTLSVLHDFTLSHISTSPPHPTLTAPGPGPLRRLRLSGLCSLELQATGPVLQQSLDRLVDTAAWWTLSVLHAFTLSHISTTQNGSRKYLEKKKWGGEEDQRLTRRQSPSTSPASTSPWRSPPLSLSGPRKKPKLESGADCQ